MNDKPHLFASDTPKKSEISPDIQGGLAIGALGQMSEVPMPMVKYTGGPLTPSGTPTAVSENGLMVLNAPEPNFQPSPSLPDIMPENIRKRRSISVKEKLGILSMVENGHKLSAVARIFGISSSTASTIVKERFKIKMLSDHYNIDPERKRMRLGIFRDVDEAVHLWFRQMRMKNIPINGPMLQQKAREFAIQLGHQNFEGSSGWLFRFRERHGLSVKTMRDNDDNNTFNCSGIGMTDDEIVTSVCQNTFNSFSFCENKSSTKDKISKVKETNNTIKEEVPENYLVPEIELTDYEPAISLPEAISLAEKLTSFLKGQNVPSDVLKSMNTISNFIEHDLTDQMKQRKITDYFKP